MANIVVDVLQLIFKSLYFVLVACTRNLLSIVYVPQKDVNGEVILITGAGSGIGRLMALKFADLGATLVLVDINKTSVDAVAKEISDKGQSAHSYDCDCSKREEIYRVAAKIKSEVGDVTMLVNNAGIVTGKKFTELPDEKVDLTLQVNTLAHLWTLKAFLPAMKAKNHGHIVTIASGAGLFAAPDLVDYCASKYGAVGIHSSITLELYGQGLSGIHTTCICPYFINTGMFDGVKTRFPWLLPIVEPDYAASKIVQAVRSNQNMLIIPRFLYIALFLQSVLPTEASLLLSDFFGITRSMLSFKGREKRD